MTKHHLFILPFVCVGLLGCGRITPVLAPSSTSNNASNSSATSNATADWTVSANAILVAHSWDYFYRDSISGQALSKTRYAFHSDGTVTTWFWPMINGDPSPARNGHYQLSSDHKITLGTEKLALTVSASQIVMSTPGGDDYGPSIYLLVPAP